jgi:3-dehydroquinate synthetase
MEGRWLPELEACLRHWQLPVSIPADLQWAAVAEAMGLDKKKAGRKMRFIAPRFIGDVVVLDDVDLEVVRAAFLQVQDAA